MTSKTFDPARRRLFRQGVVIASGATLAGLMLKAKAPAQAGTVAKTVAKYQDEPHGTQRCDGCMQFIPGRTDTADGTCKIVQGSINPKGWCMFFTAKS